MRKNIFYIIGVIFALQICFYFWHPYPLKERPKLPQLSTSELPESKYGLRLKTGRFENLFGWYKLDAEIKSSLQAFLLSCNVFLKKNPDDFVGSDYIRLQAKDWYPACKAASLVDKNSEQAAREFFEKWFVPVQFKYARVVTGLFTGYYVPLVSGSLTKSKDFSVPIYALPSNLVSASLKNFSKNLPAKTIVGRVDGNRLVPFYTREQINAGMIDDNAEVLAYVGNEVDRLTIEIEGSGVIELPNKEHLLVGFAGTNGRAYRAIASVLIENDKMKRDKANMENIKKYFQKYPEEEKNVVNANESFVFFRKLPNNKVVGSQGVPLTPGFSMAVDRKWIPMGIPLWLNTSVYDVKSKEEVYLERLMIAQDAGGSIKGIVRGDIYFGEGEDAKKNALSVSSVGHYWLLLPRLN